VKIGVFDSGIGGITVLGELRRSFPSVEYVYLGDTAHVPYGTRSAAQIRQLSADCARVLKSTGIDALVVACNTSSSLALDAICDVMGEVPVFDVVGPGVEAAKAARRKCGGSRATVLVLATRATIRSHAYGKALGANVIEQECPLLVPMIEEGWLDHPVLHRTIKEYVGAYARAGRPGVALLACTHYPWIHAAFERALPGWMIVNSAQAVARSLARSGIARKLRVRGKSRAGRVQWIFTDPDAVPAMARGME